MLEERAHIPVVGVVPYFYLDIDEEDSLTERFQRKSAPALVDVAVIRLPRISNFTDIAPLEALDEVRVRYITSPGEFGEPDAVIIPGSKNTIQDLLWMRQNGLEAKIQRYASQEALYSESVGDIRCWVWRFLIWKEWSIRAQSRDGTSPGAYGVRLREEENESTRKISGDGWNPGGTDGNRV